MIIRVCLVAALLTPAAATAQGNPGPYGKLFGRAPASSADQEHTTVEIRSTVGANYDNALLAPEGSAADTPLQRGVSGEGTAFVNVEHRSSVFVANVSGGAGRGEYFTEPTSYGTTQYFANANAHAKLSTRFDAQATARYAHSPSYQFFSGFGRGPIDADFPGNPDSPVNPGPVSLPSSAYAIQMLENDMIDASAGLTTRITEKSSLDLSVFRHQTQFAHQPDDDVVVNGYRARWQWQLQRGLGVHAGYGQEHIDLQAPDRLDYGSALIDAGLDFNRAFSIARRTTLGFSTTTSVMKRDGAENEFRVNGGVSLAKFFRRTWHASLQANRATLFLAGFTEPLNTNTVSASLGGMFSTRLDFVAFASAARGESSFSHTSGYETLNGTARLSMALGKQVSAYVSYFAYSYDVPAGAFTLSVPGRMARQVIAAGLSFYVPVYQKVRRDQ